MMRIFTIGGKIDRILRLIAGLILISIFLGCGLISRPTPGIEMQATSQPAPTENLQINPSVNPGEPTKEKPPAPALDVNLVQAADLVYLGAFRLPDAGLRPDTFEYGGNAMTFYPKGDPNGPADGHPGSLFITGHDRLPYGELTNGSQLAEIRIPAPKITKNLDELNVAEFIQDLHDVAAGHFTGLDEIPRIGLAYLDTPATGPLLHIAWGQHLQPDPPVASHGWIGLDLANPDFKGTWFIGNQSLESVNGYMFTIPTQWADTYASGSYLATGRFKDGGWGGMGPELFAYKDWTDDKGTPAADGTHLQETVLLNYENSTNTEKIERSMTGYQHPDEWEGGAWLSTTSGKTGVLFAGTKSNGDKYWYGYLNPAGANVPCVEGEMVGMFPLCRLKDGGVCPESDFTECQNHNDFRGWWTTHFDAELILYNPNDFAQVASGQIDSWAPQPYATLEIDQYLYNNPAGVETDMIGTGDQRRYRIGDVAYDQKNNIIYVEELFADGAKPVVHVWKIQ
jgi:hypothetical protein